MRTPGQAISGPPPVTYFGTLLAGAVVAPVNPTLPPAAVRAQWDGVGAVAAVTHPATWPALRAEGVGGRLELTVMVEPGAVAPGDGAEAAGPGVVPLAAMLSGEPVAGPRVRPDDPAHLSFTGGTTGRSKAVEVLHRNVVANCLQFHCRRSGTLPVLDDEGGLHVERVPGATNDWMTPPGEGVSIAVAPFFHAMGLIGMSITTLAGVATSGGARCVSWTRCPCRPPERC